MLMMPAADVIVPRQRGFVRRLGEAHATEPKSGAQGVIDADFHLTAMRARHSDAGG